MKESIIYDDDVYWVMNWDTNLHPDKPKPELIFEESKALARLLAEEVVFINSHWWEESWPEDAKKKTSLNVNCNDIFAWGCADAEEINYNEIQSLYDHWLKDNVWGPAKWCCHRRGQKPQKPVIDAMKKAGSWDGSMENLPEGE